MAGRRLPDVLNKGELMSYKKSLILSASLIASSFLALPQTAFAQSAETEEEAVAEDAVKVEDVIVVTGSYIKRDPSQSASPLAIVDR